MVSFFKTWLKDFLYVFIKEFKGIFTDSGVLLIFFIGGLGYPIIYNIMYCNGVVADTPIAVVDMADCAQSRRYIRKMDATRELKVAYKCITLEEAEMLMRRREVNGAVLFPEDFGKLIENKKVATLSVYADMSSFLYYKNLLMGANIVMLDEIHQIKIERCSGLGLSDKETDIFRSPILYEENNPYNNAFSYTIFFLSAALMLIIQQTMFYGMSLRAGTIRENKILYTKEDINIRKRGVGRIVIARGLSYALPYIGIAVYIAFIIPAVFKFPQRGDFQDIFIMLLFFLVSCVLFCEFWSSFITRRETVIVLLLFISPIAIFLTGFTWPETSFPVVWKYFSYIFPSTFACKAFINLNTAGGNLETISELLKALTIQGCVYYVLSNIAVYIESRLIIKNTEHRPVSYNNQLRTR